MLWVDAICINQNHLEEKGQQVAMMDQIYAAAEQVLIWLGKHEESDHVAFQAISDLQAHFGRKCNDSHHQFEGLNDPNRITFKNPMAGSARWAAVSALVSKKWFERVWIIQEVVMAQRALVLRRTRSIPWRELFTLIYNLTRSRLNALLNLNSDCPGIKTASISEMLQAAVGQNEPIELTDMLFLTRYLRATDPRDKIYSLVGIYNAMENLGGDVGRLDYKTPPSTLFRNVAAEHLFDKKFIDIMSFVDHGPCPEGPHSPSWVPQWMELSVSHTPFAFRKSHFRSTCSLKPKCWESPERNQLIIAGIRLDQIFLQGEMYRYEECQARKKFTNYDDQLWYENHAGRRWLRQSEAVFNEVRNEQEENEKHPERFWRTIICNMSHEGQMPGREYRDGFKAFYARVEAVCNFYDSSKRFVTESEQARSQSLANQSHYFSLAFRTWVGGRVFCTTAGKRIGMFPSAVQ